MRMSINEAITWLNTDDYESKGFADATSVAINTMRKYQKIESKIKVLQNFTEDTPLATQRMIRIVNEISEVLEDGNND